MMLDWSQRKGGSGKAFSSEKAEATLPAQLWVLVGVLMLIGLVTLYSASAAMAWRQFHDSAHYLKRQIFYIFLGLFLMALHRWIPPRFYKAVSRWLLAAIMVALCLVWTDKMGVEFNHARRWIRIGSLTLQPSEYLKVAWVLYLATYFSQRRDRLPSFVDGFLPPVVLLAVLGGLLLLEPDFGTLCILSAITLAMMIAGGVPWRSMATLIPVAAGSFYFLVWRVPYRWDRVTAFLNPWVDPLDTGYHLIQSLIAVGSGGLLGQGLGAGHQKLFFLPEPFTDFILAVFSEELGVAGLLLLASLFVALLWKGIDIALGQRDDFLRLAALGLAFLIPFQAWINMGVVLGMLPTKGLALPFISYGGSSLTACCWALGILISIGTRNGEKGRS